MCHACHETTCLCPIDGPNLRSALMNATTNSAANAVVLLVLGYVFIRGMFKGE
jgi:hypothetical protein